MNRLRLISLAIASLALAACAQTTETRPLASNAEAELNAIGARRHRQYGEPQKLGNGKVRTYITFDAAQDRVPVEVGVAMTEDVMNGLPPAMVMSGGETMKKGHGHGHGSDYILDLPAKNPTPYRFVQLNWNPNGHEPAGVYDLPHFDFHFYTVPVSVRNSIVPTDPAFAAKAASFPAAQFRAPFYLDAATAGGVAPALATVPLMGLHWLDVRSPELQMLTGHPEAFKPFTKTFIYGSWNGDFIFDEPMITRAYIMSKRGAVDPAVIDEVIPVSTAQRYAPNGYYPNAYRITYDAKAREYRIALTQLTWRD